MNIYKIILISLAAFLIGTYLYFVFIPYCRERFLYWQIRRVLRKIANRKGIDKEIKEKINNVIDMCKNVDYENKL